MLLRFGREVRAQDISILLRIYRQMRADIMGLNVDVYMGYNIKGIKERGAGKLSTDHSVEEVAGWSSLLKAAGGQ